MAASLSPAKALLLAVELATRANIETLSSLVSQQSSILNKTILLRILLTHLPETVPPARYVPFLKELEDRRLREPDNTHIDVTSVQPLSDDQAIRKTTKLHLLHLMPTVNVTHVQDSLLTLFLVSRALKVDSEAGLLSLLPELLLPFISDNQAIRMWTISTVLPIYRRTYQYFAESSCDYSLEDFRQLSDPNAVIHLLGRSGEGNNHLISISQALGGLILPWLQNEFRWGVRDGAGNRGQDVWSEGWEQTLEWMLVEAANRWDKVVQAIENWQGPKEIDLPPSVESCLSETQNRYLETTWLKACLASAYIIPDATLEGIAGAHQILRRVQVSLGHEQSGSLESTVLNLPSIDASKQGLSCNPNLATFTRRKHLQESNVLTTPTKGAIKLLEGIILSAFLSIRLNVSLNVRQAGDFTILQDHREQKELLAKLIRTISTKSSINSDEYWVQTRRQVLWLRDWGNQDGPQEEGPSLGLFGTISQQHIESLLLEAMLANSRYEVARSVYDENTANLPLPPAVVRDVVHKSALGAFDNASNPNRNRGGLRKCSEIIRALPATVPKDLPRVKQVDALLKATHALSDYKLVLKQGEPFTPVVLRVHSDPISIIGKVLEQNPTAYTRLQEFLEMGINLANAGISIGKHSLPSTLPADNTLGDARFGTIMAEKRITAMCIEAALREDDFETAYSYVVSRLQTASSLGSDNDKMEEEWSYIAALTTGQYIRSARSKPPTHLGTASGNLEIRHLQQRIECLATALQLAPSSQLQDILKTFRRCEEQLDSAIQEEAAKEDAWDAAADMSDLPGRFDSPPQDAVYPPRNVTAKATARQAEEAPMSLFDLSRATARIAQRNLTSLSNLQGVSRELQEPQPNTALQSAAEDAARVRKRDQLREAATGTLVSGVGWLIGATSGRGDK